MTAVDTTLDFVVAIPARYGSTRLPGKPLRLIAGEPMIRHVVRRATEAGAAEVVVATDDSRIAEAVAAMNIAVCMTSSDHASGTDRLAECVAQRGWDAGRIVVNLQGDEPLAPPAAIRAVAACLAGSDAPMATLAVPISDSAQLFDPNCVKLVRDDRGRALYFSRAPLPWARDAFAGNRVDLPAVGAGEGWLRHVGLYAYRAGFLPRFAAMPASWLERIESLEQLRVLQAGLPIAVDLSPVPIPHGVDTEDDLAAVEARITREMSFR
ncbi:MAG: 3-deoxy-manno-octulosonate cytidylyltransferase [Lysobacteraceae bacterium]